MVICIFLLYFYFTFALFHFSFSVVHVCAGLFEHWHGMPGCEHFNLWVDGHCRQAGATCFSRRDYDSTYTWAI